MSKAIDMKRSWSAETRNISISMSDVRLSHRIVWKLESFCPQLIFFFRGERWFTSRFKDFPIIFRDTKISMHGDPKMRFQRTQFHGEFGGCRSWTMILSQLGCWKIRPLAPEGEAIKSWATSSAGQSFFFLSVDLNLNLHPAIYLSIYLSIHLSIFLSNIRKHVSLKCQVVPALHRFRFPVQVVQKLAIIADLQTARAVPDETEEGPAKPATGRNGKYQWDIYIIVDGI